MKKIINNGDEDILIGKIIKFRYFKEDDKDSVSDCVAILENGEEVLIDPFVGCAFSYENKEHLIDSWFRMEGSWFYNENVSPETVFLPREGGMKLLVNSN